MENADSGRSWFLFRCLLAVLLAVLFHLLLVGLLAGSLWVEWRLWTDPSWDRAHSFLWLPVLVLAVLLIGCLAPAVERWRPPGPPLVRDRQPRLFAELEAVSRTLGIPLPGEIYLGGTFNASAVQPSGSLGVGGRKVLVLGLPLLAAMDLPMLRTVVGHELGHFAGGDAGLGLWVWRTEAAIRRSWARLGTNLYGLSVRWVFEAYGWAFTRITRAVSRRQELRADAVAARAFGIAPSLRALRLAAAGEAAWEAFLKSRVIPMMDDGDLLPPLAEGFRRFLRSPGVASGLESAITEGLPKEIQAPGDTHPPHRVRLENLGAGPGDTGGAADGTCASDLLEDLPALERSLIPHFLRRRRERPLADVRWEEAGSRWWIAAWKKRIRDRERWLRGRRAGDLLRDIAAPASARGRNLGIKERTSIACCAVVLALADRGWTVRAEPGEEVRAQKEGEEFDPAARARGIVEKKIAEEAWTAFCDRHGIAEADLGDPGPG